MEHFSGDIIPQRALYLLQTSIIDSDTWHILNFQQATALNASKEIKRIVGIRLAREQWKVEVENIFVASLSGMQIRAYDYARGTYAQRPSMIDRTPRELQGGDSDVQATIQVARLFKYRSQDFQNISAFGFWGINGLCIAVLLGSRRFSNAERGRKQKRRLEVEVSITTFG